MLDLLPHNATDQERALDLATARVGDVPVPVRDLWNPGTCAENLLPWLAWAFSVDKWDPAWTSDQKRESVRRAIEVQRIKGTIGAVRRGLGAIDIDAIVLEWHLQETVGTPYTYQLLIDGTSNAATLGEIFEAIDAVENLKSLRSHMEFVQISASSTSGPYMGVVASVGTDVVLSNYVGPPLNPLGIWDDSLVWNDAKSWGLEL